VFYVIFDTPGFCVGNLNYLAFMAHVVYNEINNNMELILEKEINSQKTKQKYAHKMKF